MQITIIQDARIVPALCDLFAGARREIIILQYQFRAPEQPRTPMLRVLTSLRLAAETGVGITILLNKPDRPRRPGPSHGALSTWLNHPNICILHHTRKEILHVKAAAADGERLILGSHNMSQASFASSRNISVLIEDQPTVAAFVRAASILIRQAKDATS